MEIVFETDFATNYNATRNAWATNAQDFVGTTAADPFNGQVVAASVTGAVGSVAAGGITASSIATDAIDADAIAAAAITSSEFTALSSTALSALEDQYDGTGLSGDTYPATQAQIGNIASGSAAISTTVKANPDGFTITTGSSEVNNEDSTFELDGTYHSLEDTAGTTDCYYEFDIGEDGVPVSIKWWGFANSVGDSYTVEAYNWAGTAWQQVGTITASAGTAVNPEVFDLTSGHVGTGANVGLVRLRFYSTDGTKITTDRILCSYAQSITGIANGSTVTLSASTTNTNLVGNNWTLAMGGQDVSGAYVKGATVSGTGTGSNVTFEDCHFSAGASIPAGTYLRCGFAGTVGSPITESGTGQYVFKQCYSEVAGSGTPYFNFAGAGGTVGVNNRGWTGGVHFTGDSNVTVSHEVLAGGGTTFVTGGGNAEIRGICRELTITVATNETVQFVGTTGDITVGDDGASTATINLFGISDTVTDNTSGSTINDRTVSRDTVNAEVDTALDTAISELGVAAPAAEPGLRDAVMLMYMAMRNKLVVQTSGTDALEIYNDAGTKIASKALSDDGSDYTEAEMS
jgi:hypothetical protein